MQLIETKKPSFAPTITERRSVNGRVLGTRTAFSGNGMTAREIKAKLRAQGVTSGLTQKVNDILTGEADIRWMLFDAKTSALRSSGLIPENVDEAKSTATARFIRPTVIKAKAEKTPTQEGRDLALAALLATGHSKESAEKALRLAGVPGF